MVKNIYMDNQRRKDLNLRLGNLIIAIFLATVPTAITYGTLSIHGLNICRTLSSKVENSRDQNNLRQSFLGYYKKLYIFNWILYYFTNLDVVLLVNEKEGN